MARNIVVHPFEGVPVEQHRVEMVERKGIGHPDSIMDGMMEEVSRALCRYYLKNFGCILHHNTDKGQLSSGESSPVFGGGRIIDPIFIQLSGQATEKCGKDLVPVDEIAKEAARKYLGRAVPLLDSTEHCKIDSKIVMGSADLRDNFERKVPGANDTSFGVGFAPLSRVERLVLETEKFLNSSSYKNRMPAVGPDIKVMGLRRNGNITLTVAAAMVSSKIKNLNEYLEVREQVRKDIGEFAAKKVDLPVEVVVNNLDNSKRKSVYITVTGTSAEMGDAGAVGRGNRVNGLITPNRPMSLEAAAGKNPVRHVGKIYNLLANEAAKAVIREVPQISSVQIALLSQIGRPIDDPLVADVQIISENDKKCVKEAEAIMDEQLKNVCSITEKVIAGELDVF